MDEREQILNELKTLKGDKINICGEIYEILKGSGDRAGRLLQFFYEVSETIVSSEEREAEAYFTEAEEADYPKSYGKIIDGILEKLFKKRPNKELFYAELWDMINLKELFEEDKQRIFALYYVWIDIRIPYFQLPEVRCLEGEEYRQIVERIGEKLQEVRFVLASEFQKWTEVSSFLLKLMENLDEDERIVFLACAMRMRERMMERTAAEAREDE